MPFAHYDTSEVAELARDLSEAYKSIPPMGRSVTRESAKRVVDGWVHNAQELDWTHGKLYQRTIGFDGPIREGGTFYTIVGPDASMPQGGMGRGFEYGSINQHGPHLEGNRAADAEEEKFQSAALEGFYSILRVQIER